MSATNARGLVVLSCLMLFGCGAGSSSDTASGNGVADASLDGSAGASGRDASTDGVVGSRPDADASDDGRLGEAAMGEPDSGACSPGFAFKPTVSGTGDKIYVSFTFDEPLAYVGLRAKGPGTSKQGKLVLSGSHPWTWTWPMTFDKSGSWSFTFTAKNPPQVYGKCRHFIGDTGAPPDLPQADCSGKVCGESDGASGTCDACPVVGTCLSNVSPYGPSGPGSWSCLDSAGCAGSNCRIWCPGEPCDSKAHPDGCPQGVETCFVDPHIANYEDACRTCCESRVHTNGQHACWDNSLSLCRYPGDCGKPLLNPP